MDVNIIWMCDSLGDNNNWTDRNINIIGFTFEVPTPARFIRVFLCNASIQYYLEDVSQY